MLNITIITTIFVIMKGFINCKAQFRRRASAVPNLNQIGSTVAGQKYDCDSDVEPESYQIQDLLY